MATPGALRAIRAAGKGDVEPFNADDRAKRREQTPVTIAEVTFSRRRKDWAVNRRMRQAMRSQETAIARSTRLRARIAELEAEQIECATKGETGREDELEGQIAELVAKADDAMEEGELVSYRLLALLLIPPPGEGGAPSLPGWGPDAEEAEAVEAVAFLQPALDVEDAAALAAELSGSREPDPQETPSSGSGSS